MLSNNKGIKLEELDIYKFRASNFLDMDRYRLSFHLNRLFTQK